MVSPEASSAPKRANCHQKVSIRPLQSSFRPISISANT
ncbi:hypothetical protein AYI69_g10243, partial [Smittium culicis]